MLGSSEPPTHPMVRFNLKEERRKHADRFLPRDVPLDNIDGMKSVSTLRLISTLLRKLLTTSVSKTRNEWNFLNSGDFRITFLATLNCHASPSGYLSKT